MNNRRLNWSFANRNRPGRIAVAFAACLALCVALCLPSAAPAGEGEIIQMPNFGAPKNGLRLRLNTMWVEGPGYRPVHVEIETSNGLPSKEDRRIQVEIMPSSNWGFQRYIAGEFVLPQGDVSVSGHLLVPQTSDWYNMHLNTTENGRKLKDLSGMYLGNNMNNSGFDTTKPKMLVIDSAAPTLSKRAVTRQTNQNLRNSGQSLPPSTYNMPDIRGLVRWNPVNNFPQVDSVVDDATLIDVVYGSANLEVLPPKQLPDQWIAFSSIDLIFVSLDELIDIRKTRPRLATALKEWAGTGGSLVVYGVGENFQRLNQLEFILDVHSRTNLAPIDRWKPGGTTKDRNAGNLQALSQAEWFTIRQHLSTHPDPEIKKTGEELTALQSEWNANTVENGDWFPFRVLEFGHGKVLAMPEKDPFPGSHQKWSWLGNTIQPYSNWNARVGLDLQNGDPNFLSYLIPGVGLPPVNTFRLLITLFVIVIGPVNYLLLKRRKRLFLLLVTVPLGAGIVTFSLFSFALIKDGLSVQTRVHSFTSLDQRAGVASSWSRQTYFASLPPSKGLEYPDSAAVHMVFDSDWQTRRAQEATTRSMLWDDDTQRLRRGYLGSRTTTEFIVASSEAIGEANLLFKSQGAGKPPQVVNQLGVAVEKLLIVADDGTTYWAENIAPEKTETPKQKERSAAIETLQTLARKNQPVDPGFHAGAGSFFFGYRTRYQTNATVSGPGILGHGRYRSMFAAPNSDDAIGPGEFIAIVPRSPFVPLGVDSNNEEASFHVIRGRYVAQ